MSTSTLAPLVPSVTLFRPSLKPPPSCTIPHSYLASFSQPPLSATTARKSVAIYLMEKLSFTEEQSLSISKKLVRIRECNPSTKHATDLVSFENADKVISYLQDDKQQNGCCLGLDISHIKKLIFKHPKVLTADVNKTIKPKIEILQELGTSTSDLAHVLSLNPRLYLTYDLAPVIRDLRDILGFDEDVVKMLKGLKYGTANNIVNNLVPNVTMLENEYGVSKLRVRKFLCSTPCVLMLKTETLRDGIVKIEEKWGISRDCKEFLRAVHFLCGLSEEKINSKCDVFRSFGWLECDIMSMIRRHPSCMSHSESAIRKALEFYMNELGYDPAYMASRTALFSRSLENRVVPRHRILVILKEKGLVNCEYQLYTAIKLTENQFLDKFILPFENVVPRLREVYRNGT